MRHVLPSIARRPALLVIGATILPILLRLLMLPWAPVPDPIIHDEFGHLLIADTLASGRLANPPHPMSRHLETLYILQQPAYASIYPIGQGLALLAGQILFGHAWAGVLLAVGLMCGAIGWMLLGCVPATWAATGTLIAASLYGMHYDWVNTYWGGAFCAFGGALLFGALCRLYRAPSGVLGLVAGLGWSIVWLIRPYESAPLLVVTWGLIGWLAWRSATRWRLWLPAVALMATGQFAGVATSALHNRSVTGSFTKLPYQLNRETYGVPQTFIGQPDAPKPKPLTPESSKMYDLHVEIKERAIREWHWKLLQVVWVSFKFYAGPWFLIALLMLAPLSKDRAVLAATGVLAIAIVAAMLYSFFFPHYIAAGGCLVVYLIVRGLRELWEWTFRGRPWGRGIAFILATGGILSGVPVTQSESLIGYAGLKPMHRLRAQALHRLERGGGRHLVFVRYGPQHNFLAEWVYNTADVDRAPIVWCRSISGGDDAEAARYFSGRRVWLATVDRHTATLAPYEPASSAPSLGPAELISQGSEPPAGGGSD